MKLTDPNVFSRRLLRLAIGFFSLAVAFVIVASTQNHNDFVWIYLFIGCMEGGLLMVLASIAVILFGILQIRLIELLFLVMVLGNASGGIIYCYRGSSGDEIIVILGILMTFCACYILVGATGGIWIANELRRNNTWMRLWLMLVGILAPLALISLIVGILQNFSKLNLISDLFLSLSLAFNLYFWSLIIKIRHQNSTGT